MRNSYIFLMAFGFAVCFVTSANAGGCSQAIVETPSCKIGMAIRSEVGGGPPSPDDSILQEAIKCGEAHTDNIGMNSCADLSLKKYDDALNLVYKAALDSVDEKTRASLRNSQRQWLKFYEAENTARALLLASDIGKGTQIYAKAEREEILRQRIAQLAFYLEESEDPK